MGTVNKLYGVKSSADVKAWGLSTGKLAFDADYLNSFEIDEKEDNKEYAHADGVTKKVAFDGEKTVTINMGCELGDIRLFAWINKAKLVNDKTPIFYNERISIASSNQEVTPNRKLKELKSAMVKGADGTLKKDLTSSCSVAEDGKITLNGANVGDIVEITYTSEVKAPHFSMMSQNEVTEDYFMVANVIGKTVEGGEAKAFQYQFPKVSPNTSLTYTYDGTKVAGYTFSAEVLAGTLNGKDDVFVDYIELPSSDEDGEYEGITDLGIIAQVASNSVLGFTIPNDGETPDSIKLQYSTGGTLWNDVVIDSSEDVNPAIDSAITVGSKNVTVKNVTNGMKFKIILTYDAESIDSNIVTATVA